MNTDRRNEIGSRLRESREACRLSQEDAAAELKISGKTISAWERGDRMPSAERLVDLCLVYGVSADFILFGTHMVPSELSRVFQRASRAAEDGSPASGG